MAETYSSETNGKLDVAGRAQIAPEAYRAGLHRIRATIPYDGQADGDTIVLGELPTGAVFAYGVMNVSATAGGTATIAIGISGTATKYKAAATFTAANTPTMFGNVAAVDDVPLTSEERVIATVGAAALPDSADFMVVDLYYSRSGC